MAKDMKAARAARKKGPRTPPAQILQRADHAYMLLCFGGKPMQIRQQIMDEYKVCATGADRALKAARKMMREAGEKSRQEHLELALSQLECMIRGESGAVRLGAVNAKINLLGLSEPKKTEVDVQVTVVPYDPARTEAMRDPTLRAKLLNLESEISLLPIFSKEPDHGQEHSAENRRDPEPGGSGS